MGYADFVRQNSNSIGNLESGLRSASFLLPGTLNSPKGRFRDSEIISEFINANIKLISQYHDSILSKEAWRQSLKPPSLAIRYYKALMKNPLYSKLSILMAWVQSFEVVGEMIVRKRLGEAFQKKYVILLETLKLICRLFMFKINGFRSLQRFPLPDRDYDISALEPKDGNPGYWAAPRSKKDHLTTESLCADNAIQYMLAKATSEPTSNALELVPQLSGAELASEVLFLIRPLIYGKFKLKQVLLIQKYGIKSYKPWTVSLSLEAITILSKYTIFNEKQSTQLEKQILGSRLSNLSYYLLKKPFYDQFTKPRLESIAQWAKTKTILNIFGSILNDYIPLWDNYYYYTNNF